MAKKKHEAPRPDEDGILRTGIYQRRVVRKQMSPEEFQKKVEASFEKLATKRSINVWVAEWMENLAEGIKPHLDEQGHTEYALDLGDGWQGYRVADDLPEQVRDLIDCMNELRVLSSHISSENTLSGDLTWVVFTSFKLGRLAEKIRIRPFEPLVKKGIGKVEKSRDDRKTAGISARR